MSQSSPLSDAAKLARAFACIIKRGRRQNLLPDDMALLARLPCTVQELSSQEAARLAELEEFELCGKVPDHALIQRTAAGDALFIPQPQRRARPPTHIPLHSTGGNAPSTA